MLDQLASLNVASVAGALAGKLDLERVGFLGHSVGGVAAGEVCQWGLTRPQWLAQLKEHHDRR